MKKSLAFVMSLVLMMITIVPGIFPASLAVAVGFGETQVRPLSSPQAATATIDTPWRTQFSGICGSTNCGPASLGMSMALLGVDHSNDTIRRAINEHARDSEEDCGIGTNWADLAWYAKERAGFQTEGPFSGWSIDGISSQVAQGRPVLLLVHYRSLPGHEGASYTGDHFIVFQGIRDDGLVSYDDSAFYSASDGDNRTMSQSQLMAAWSSCIDGNPQQSAMAVYQSGGGDNTPPDGEITSPSEDQTITNRTVYVGGWAEDNVGGSGFNHAHFTAYYNGSWRQVGPDFYASPFGFDWDMCNAGVPDGEVTLGLDIWDNAGNVASSPSGNRHFTKSYDCGGDPPEPPPSGTWYVEYFSDTTLTTRCSPANMTTSGPFVFKDWGDSSAYPACPSDNWSARFWRTVHFQSGTYTFGLGSDDWARVSIDQDIVLNNWQGAGQHYATRTYSEGDRHVTVEFADTLGSAKLAAWWSGPGYAMPRESRDPYQWYAQYWGNKDLWWDSIVRVNEGTGTLSHSWGSGGPGYGIPVDQFSSRFERQVYFSCGTYRFDISTDDGVRFWTDAINRLDRWMDQATSYSVDVNLAEGYHELKIEHYENGGGANIGLSWSQLAGCIPNAPTNLVATTASQSQIDLIWTDNATNEDGFKLERSLDGTSWTLIATLGTNLISYSDTGLNPGTTYHYRVYAFNTAGDSVYSNVVDATTPSLPPAAPSDLVAAAASESQIDLTWVDNADNEDGFKLERSLDGTNWALITILGTDVTSRSDTGLNPGTTYYYRVYAFNIAGDSAYSNMAEATTPSLLPAAPSDLVATAVSDSQIDLTWVDNAANEDGFRIERSLYETSGFAPIDTVSTDATSYSDTGLSPDTHYYYRVYAFNTAGDSDYSNVADATTPSLPPAAPSDLVAITVSESQIDLTWADNADNEDGFKLERSLDGTNWTLIATLGADATSRSDTGLSPATTYYYRVYAFNTAGDSIYATDEATTLPVGERTIHVPQDYLTISQALDAASPGDTVQVAAGTYSEQNLGISDGVVLLGSGADQTIIQGNGTGTVVNIGGNAVISGFTVTGSGANWWDSGIWISDGQAKISENIVTGNSMGIVYYCWSPCEGQPRIQNNIVFGNEADGILAHDGIVAAVNNTSVYNGMTGIAVDRVGSTIQNNVFSGNGIGIAGTNTMPIADYNNVWGNGEDYNLVSPGAHDISADSLFVSPSTDDYRISAASPNVDSGASIDLEIDVEGDIRPYDGNGDGTAAFDIGADEYVGPPALPPLSPSELLASAVSESQIDLTWVDNADNEDGFRIERSLYETSGFAQIDTVSADITSYSDTGLSAGTHYYYRVYAFNTVGDSATYAAGDASTLSVAPAAPSDLVATTVSQSQIDLTWTDSSTDETGFRIERSLYETTGFTMISTLGANATNYSDTGLSAGTTYYYRLYAFNTAGDSAYSDVASAETDPPAGNMHVGDLDGSKTSSNKKFWWAGVTILMHDAAHNPVSGATVTGSWSSGAPGASSCVTDQNGECSVLSDKLLSSDASVTFSVDNVSHATLPYDPTANHDPEGDSDGTTIVVSQAGNQPPVASFTYECVGLACTFDGSGSYDPDGTIVDYAWDFGDGNGGMGATASHPYLAEGTYTVILTATDDQGATGSEAQDISVGASPMTMRVSAIDLTGKTAGSNRSATVVVAIVDGDGNPLSGATVSGRWSDAYTAEVSGVTGGDGTVSFTSGKVRQANAKFTFTVEGVVKSGYLYDAEHSVTSAWILVP